MKIFILYRCIRTHLIRLRVPENKNKRIYWCYQASRRDVKSGQRRRVRDGKCFQGGSGKLEIIPIAIHVPATFATFQSIRVSSGSRAPTSHPRAHDDRMLPFHAHFQSERYNIQAPSSQIMHVVGWTQIANRDGLIANYLAIDCDRCQVLVISLREMWTQ